MVHINRAPLDSGQDGASHRGPSGWIDISAGLLPDQTPMYPGNLPLEFTWVRSFSRGDNYTLTGLSLDAHTGTHLDAPLHLFPDGQSIDQISLDKLIGPARIIECPRDAMIIDLTELNRHDWKGVKRILFKTRNSFGNFMGDKNFHQDFTALAPDAAQALADAGIELVGIDYMSIEKFGSPEPLVHLTLLGKNIVVVEGLNLGSVSGGDYDLVCLPVKLVGREGALARAAVRPREAR